MHSGGLEGLFGFRCRSVPPFRPGHSPPLLFSLFFSLLHDSSSIFIRDSEKSIRISVFFSFLSFRHSLEGIEGMCVRLSSSLSPDLSLICASFNLPLLATAFPRAHYIPASLLRVMLSMESIGLLTLACSYQRLAVSIPISFPLTIPHLPSSSIITTSWIHSLFRLHEDLEPGTLFSPCTI